MKIIGIGGVARSGKDTLAKCVEIAVAEKGGKAKIISLASPLKEKMRDFLLDNFDIDVFNCSDSEKALIRPLLVAYGKAKRELTSGSFFTILASKAILKAGEEGFTHVVIPDIRYKSFNFDETDWLFSNNGVLLHVTRIKDDGTVLEPPNEDEKENDPKVKEAANAWIKWPTMDFDLCYNLTKEKINRFL